MSQNVTQLESVSPLVKPDSFYELRRVERFISDIKTPISALRVISSAKSIPSEVRSLIESSLDRITDLARDLFEGQPALLYSLQGPLDCREITESMSDLIDEKRRLFTPQNFDVELLKEGSFLEDEVIRVPRFHWKRVFSNTLDNAVESLDLEGGKITLKFQQDAEGAVECSIQDNGRGLPLHFVEKVGRRGFSYGKRRSFGLGAFWARKEIEAIGGQYQFESTMGFGSKVTIRIPRY